METNKRPEVSNNFTSSPINETECAIINGSWIIAPELVKKLTAFFLLHDTWKEVKKDIIPKPEQYRYILVQDNFEYTVILKSSPRILEQAEDIGLSFRRSKEGKLATVLIKAWKKDNKEGAK